MAGRRSSFVDTYLSRDAPRLSTGRLDVEPRARRKAERASFDEATARALRRTYHPIMSMDAYSRHKMMINNYMRFYGPEDLAAYVEAVQRPKSDMDVLREAHQFLWDEDGRDGRGRGSDRELSKDEQWARRLAKRYYDKLFKEYALADLSRYRESKIGFRWRTEAEVIRGKGQFICGNKRCSNTGGLKSYEVNFGYIEHGTRKNALVKVRMCPKCAVKLFYKSVQEMRDKRRDRRRRKRRKKSSKKHKKRKKESKKRRKRKEQPRDEAEPHGRRDSGSSSGTDSDSALEGHALVAAARAGGGAATSSKRKREDSTTEGGRRTRQRLAGVAGTPSVGPGAQAESGAGTGAGAESGAGTGAGAESGAGTGAGAGAAGAGAGAGAGARVGAGEGAGVGTGAGGGASTSGIGTARETDKSSAVEAEPVSREDEFDAFLADMLQ